MLEQTARRVAIYARVSTEDQAERGTIQGQLDFFVNYVSLYGLHVAGKYVDDGWSGTVPLGERPDGRRLLEDARTGCFDEVIVYRLDRLGRSLRALLEAHSALEAAGVTIRSATETFDTASSIGRFVFQLLGSLAELERSTILERTGMGRHRAGREGRWIGGPVPLGYDLDDERRPVLSTRMVASLGITEAELARQIFERIVAGSSTKAEVRRLNALGVPCDRRYAGGAVAGNRNGLWYESRLARMIHNPIYKGEHTLQTTAGPVTRAVPAIITPELWQAAADRLTRNKLFSTRNGKRQYLLRGLIRCGNCGRTFTGQYAPRPGRLVEGYYYYRCGSQFHRITEDTTCRCDAKVINGTDLEAAIWADCRAFIMNPGDALAEAQRQLREQLTQSSQHDGERQRLLASLHDKETERERILTLFQRGRLTLDEAEARLEDITRESADLRALLDGLTVRAELARTWEARMTDAAVMLGQLRDNLAAIEESDDRAAMRQIIETLLHEVVVHTTGQGRDKTATLTIRYAFGGTSAIDTTSLKPTAPPAGCWPGMW